MFTRYLRWDEILILGLAAAIAYAAYSRPDFIPSEDDCEASHKVSDCWRDWPGG